MWQRMFALLVVCTGLGLPVGAQAAPSAPPEPLSIPGAEGGVCRFGPVPNRAAMLSSAVLRPPRGHVTRVFRSTSPVLVASGPAWDRELVVVTDSASGVDIVSDVIQRGPRGGTAVLHVVGDPAQPSYRAETVADSLAAERAVASGRIEDVQAAISTTRRPLTADEIARVRKLALWLRAQRCVHEAP